VNLKLVFGVGLLIAGSAAVLGFNSAAGSLPQSTSSAASFLKFDHALICVSELAPMQQGLAEVGLKPDYGGHHGHATTQMAQLGFPDGTYIGVEAPVDAAVETGTPQSALMKANAGPCGWSATSYDLKADLERISRLGVKVGAPEARSRTRPDGTSAEWRSASLGPGAPGSNLPFLMEDKTPRSNRAPHASSSIEGTTLSGVGVVVLGVKNLDESIALFRKVYGWPAPKLEDHPELAAKIAYFAGTPVMLAVASSPDSWVAERITRLGPCPIAFLLRAGDFKAASEHFALPAGKRWFNLNVSWFDVQKLHGVRLGIVGGQDLAARSF
jgi:catechol 2,3-dioxygenase-like lactoylglutathione lyase family enzyme